MVDLGLAKLQATLSKPRGTQDVATIMQRLGRAKQRFARAAQHYEITVATDPEGKRVTAITWVKRIKPGSAAAHPGVYCLRTTLVDQDNATLWRTLHLAHGAGIGVALAQNRSGTAPGVPPH